MVKAPDDRYILISKSKTNTEGTIKSYSVYVMYALC